MIKRRHPDQKIRLVLYGGPSLSLVGNFTQTRLFISIPTSNQLWFQFEFSFSLNPISTWIRFWLELDLDLTWISSWFLFHLFNVNSNSIWYWFHFHFHFEIKFKRVCGPLLPLPILSATTCRLGLGLRRTKGLMKVGSNFWTGEMGHHSTPNEKRLNLTFWFHKYHIYIISPITKSPWQVYLSLSCGTFELKTWMSKPGYGMEPQLDIGTKTTLASSRSLCFILLVGWFPPGEL